MSSPAITIYTQVYNAQRYLKKAIESVLNQTFSDYEYIIVDNGSTDGSRKIIEEYATKDDRIKTFYYDDNIRTTCRLGFDHDHFNGEYFISLDADDWYESNALASLYLFATKNDTDITICGSQFFSSEKTLGLRASPSDFVFDRNDVLKNFTFLYQFFRTFWAKLYRMSLIRKFDRSDFNLFFERNVIYASDTVLVLDIAAEAKKVGLMKAAFHHYLVHPASATYRFEESRFFTDTYLYEKSTRFLTELGGANSEHLKFLRIVYINAIIDTMNIIVKAQMDTADKLNELTTIYTHPLSKEAQYLFDEKRYVEFSKDLLLFLLNVPREKEDHHNEKIAEILLCAFKSLPALADKKDLVYLLQTTPEIVKPLATGEYDQALRQIRRRLKRQNQDDPHLPAIEHNIYLASNKSDGERYALLMEMKKDRPKASKAIDADKLILQILEKLPILQCLSISLASALSKCVAHILKGKTKLALEAYVNALADIEIADEDADSFFIFGQNLAALAEDTGVYIYCKKIWISHLLDCSRLEEAKGELDDMLELIPGDEDIAQLMGIYQEK